MGILVLLMNRYLINLVVGQWAVCESDYPRRQFVDHWHPSLYLSQTITQRQIGQIGQGMVQGTLYVRQKKSIQLNARYDEHKRQPLQLLVRVAVDRAYTVTSE